VTTPHITGRERDVLVRLALRNAEIAEQLGITKETVTSHLGKLFRVFAATTRTDLLVTALKADVVHVGELVGGVR
jgi:DNA-binding CsgD family transcriptional regulator